LKKYKETYIMNNKIKRFITLYPWYSGFTADLLFYIAIDTLFLTQVKNFSAAQIVSVTSISQFACIVLQFPVLFIIKRIGNTNSVRIGGLCLLLSSILITFGKNYYLVLLGRLFHDIAVIFRTASYVILENNLDLVGKRNDFVRIRTAANTVYAVVTMVISFVASLMFNLNNYLPMFGCIATCAIGFLLSFFMKDYSDYDRIPIVSKKHEKVKIHYSKLIILAIIVYCVFISSCYMGQSQGKLFIQEYVVLSFNIEETALIVGAIVCISRIIRVLSNVVFAKLYEKHQKTLGVALPVLLCLAIGFIFFGSFIPLIFAKIVVMAVGYIIILFARDPFRLFMQDTIFENTPKQQHQTLLTVLEFGVKVGTAGMGLSFSAILLKYPMFVVMVIMFLIALVEVLLSIKLYKSIMAPKETE